MEPLPGRKVRLERLSGLRTESREDFDPNLLVVNASRFLRTLSLVLDEFHERLTVADWDSAEWNNVRTKMKALCENCHG